MKYVDEYRNKEQVQQLAASIRRKLTRPWRIMEVCGGQTHAILHYRLEEVLPHELKLLHGPGCPVCVTPEYLIDQAIDLSMRPEVILASFGDMMRVPGSAGDLAQAKAHGADVRILYSPLDAVQLAAERPEKEVVFFAIGFETTLPAHLTALKEARRQGLENFSLLTSFFAVPPVMEAILADPSCGVDGFLAAGHVCAITGNEAYYPLAVRYRKPVVVTGFEPTDLLYGIYLCLCRLESGAYGVENAYKRAVSEEGNPKARALIHEMLEASDSEWRGLGRIKSGGLQLCPPYAAYDAGKRFALRSRGKEQPAPPECIAGEIMRGYKQPAQCLHFRTTCTPQHPVGAPMVSPEGVCAAYYRYHQKYETNE
jgi:hydrogenase expression/formation protein HypD